MPTAKLQKTISFQEESDTEEIAAVRRLWADVERTTLERSDCLGFSTMDGNKSRTATRVVG